MNPGSSTTFTLYVNNTSSVADSYVFSAGTAGGPPVSGALPAGWTISYFADASAGACTTLGAVVINTGVINASASKVFCAVVSVPANATPVTQAIYFQAQSPSSGARDVKYDAVTVSTVRSLTLTPPNDGQVFPGGSVVYSHILTNQGNVLEGDGIGSTITMTDPMSGITAGWNNIVYWDSNNDGILDPADKVVSNVGMHTQGFAGLAPGASTRLFVKVLSPGSAAIGDINTSTLTATTTNVGYTTTKPADVTAKDTTQVIAGQVRMVKTQALDAACDGTADTAFSNAIITANAVPGVCVLYKVVATNEGTADVTSLVISDATPANTTLNCGTGNANKPAVSGGGSISPLVVACSTSYTGTIQANVGTLTPGASVTMTFGIKINQ